MKWIPIIIFLIYFTSDIFGQQPYYIVTFQSIKDTTRISKIKIRGIEYLNIHTKDKYYNASQILTISDSVIVCKRLNNIDTITVSSIKSFKKMNGALDGTGYIILGGLTILYAIALPFETIKEGRDGALNVTLGVFGLAAVTAMPLIISGEIAYRYKAKKWRLKSIDKFKYRD